MPTPPLSPLTPALIALIIIGTFVACFVLALAGHWLAQRLKPAWRWLDHRHEHLVSRLPETSGAVLRLPLWLLQRRLAELAALATAGLILLGSGALFIEITEEVIEPERLAQFDRAVFAQLQAWREPWLDTVMVAVTELGGVWVTLPLVIVVAATLLATGHRAAAFYWLGAHLASRLSVAVLKATLGRDRPIEMYYGWEAYSFPSGHATTAMVTYGFLWVLLGHGRPRLTRCALFAGAAVLVAMIGASRLYLGVHWFSDVIAGFTLGLAWITLLAVAYRLFHDGDKQPPRWLAPLVLATIAIAWGLRCWLEFPQLLERYAPQAQAVVALGS